jgi:alpha-L-rhamnosidase
MRGAALPRRRHRVAVVTLVAVATTFTSPVADPSIAHADDDEPPEAPSGLTVDDRERHLNVEGTPRFGWLPQDTEGGETQGNEIQAAYQIQVFDASGAELVWDSGKVPSREQSYVPYEGPELDPGSTYTWTVRTWDRNDLASPWAELHSFDMGISDADWEGAQWIRRTTNESDDYTLARKEVVVGDSPVVRARTYLAVAHTAELYLNGVRVDRGTSFGYPGEQYYQAADVTEFVEEGEPLAIGVLYHWYGNGQGRPGGQRGLLVKVVIEHADGSRDVFTTDGSWKVTRATWFQSGSGTRNGEGDRIDRQDARGEIAGWNLPGFDDTGWLTPQVVGPHPSGVFTHLTGQETRMVETVVHPVSVGIAADGTIVADFGRVIPARPEVRFDDGVAGRSILMRAGYNLTETGRVATSTLLTQGTNMTFPYIQKAGPQQYRAFTHLGFRYLEIPGAAEDITVDDITAVVVHTDTLVGRQATFASSDETLDAVWDLVTRSAIYSVQEAFVDTPTREKAQFLGDAADISYTTMAAFAERDHTQQALREFIDSQTRFWNSGNDVGRYNAVYPNGDGKRDIPDYSEMFPNWVWRYYQESGDRDLLDQAYPAIQNTADYVLRHIPDNGPTAGLVTNLSGGTGPYLFGIVDWPMPSRFGYDMTAAARTTINALAVEVLRVAGDVAQELGRPASEIEFFRERRAALVETMNQTLRRPDGAYVDGLLADGTQSAHAGQHSTSYAIAFGIAPEEDHAGLADYVASLGMAQGPMTVHWLLQALADADRADAVLELLTNEDDLGWANILAQDGTFTWEAWTLDPGTNFSQSHGWGSQAAVDILGTMLGVRLSGAGATDLEIVVPRDVLDHAAGTVHTQRGEVGVSWRRVPTGGVVLHVDIPVNVRARVSLPAVSGRSYRGAGGGKPVFIGLEDGREIFEVGSGSTNFFTVAAGRG